MDLEASKGLGAPGYTPIPEYSGIIYQYTLYTGIVGSRHIIASPTDKVFVVV
jgi:hypothetical protein